MRRRRNADEVARLLREANRDLAKRLAISDICRKQGIAELDYITCVSGMGYHSGEAAASWAGPAQACNIAGGAGLTNRP
jgi:hypothetical protein